MTPTITWQERIIYRIGSVGVWLCDHCKYRPCTAMEAKYAWMDLKEKLKDTAASHGLATSESGPNDLAIIAGIKPPNGPLN